MELKDTPAASSELGPQFSKQHWGAASALLVASSFVSKTFGIVRDMMVAHFFGAGSTVDAFQVGLSVSSVLGAGTGIAAATAVVPHYLRISSTAGPKQAQRFATQAVALILMCSMLGSTLVAFFPGIFVSAGAPRLPLATHVMASDILQTLAFMITGLNLVYLFTALYHAHHHFKIPTFGELLSQTAVVLSLCLFATSSGIRSLGWGMIAGSALAVVLQAIPLVRSGFFQFGPPILGVELAAFLGSLLPILMCDYSFHAQLILQNFLSSGLQAGSIASLAFASSLRNAIVTVVATNVARGSFPVISQLLTSANQGELRRVVSHILRYITICFVPVTFFCAFNSSAIVRVMFMRGRFDESATQSTALAFSIFSWGLLLNGLIPILLRICYAAGRFREALLAMSAGLLTFYGTSAVLMPKLGMVGIAISSTVSLVPVVFGIGFSVRRILGGINLKQLIARLVIASMGSCCCSSISYLAKPTGLMGLLITGTLFVLAYLAISFVFLREDMNGIWQLLRGKARGRDVMNPLVNIQPPDQSNTNQLPP